MATIITIDLDTMDDAAAHVLATSVARFINRNGGLFGYPGVQGTVVQHLPEPVRAEA